MFDYVSTSSPRRSSRALEIAMHARATEKKQALMTAELRADAASVGNKNTAASRSLIARLMATLRIF